MPQAGLYGQGFDLTLRPSSSDGLSILFWYIPYLKWTAPPHPEIGAASGSVSPDDNALSNKIRNVSVDGWVLRGLEETPPQIE